MLLFLVCVACLSVCVKTQSYQTTGRNQTVYIDKLGESRTLNCTPPNDYRPQGYRVKHWVLTNMAVLQIRSGNENPAIWQNGWQLRVENIGLFHLGDYLCVLEETNGNDTQYRKTTLELKRKPLSEIYRLNIIIGVSAALITLVFMIGICLLYHFRWRPHTDNEIQVYQGTPPSKARTQTHPVYENQSFDQTEKRMPSGDMVVEVDTKM